MSEKENILLPWAHAMLKQARADFSVATYLFSIAIDEYPYCGNVPIDAGLAKIQQAIEKAVKALVLATHTNELRAWRIATSGHHMGTMLTKNEEDGAEGLRKAIDFVRSKVLVDTKKVPASFWKKIDDLVPAKPPEPQNINDIASIKVGLNTEYPYRQRSGDPVAPCDGVYAWLAANGFNTAALLKRAQSLLEEVGNHDSLRQS